MTKLQYNYQAAKDVLNLRIESGTVRERYTALARFCEYCDAMADAGASALEMRARKSAAKLDIFKALRNS